MILARLIQTIQNRFFRLKGVFYGPGVVLYPTARLYNYCGVENAIRIGACSHIKGELLTFGHGGSISLGEYCFLGEGARIWSAERIHIGDRVLISHNVNIFDNDTHPLDPRQRQAQFKAIITGGHPRHLDLREKPVRIEDDALIGCMAIILSGVTIGAGAIVGAGSVVTKDVPPLTVVAGNPARIIRRLAGADLREG